MRKRTALFAVIAVVAATFATSGPLGAQTGGEIDVRSGPERVSGSVSSDFELRNPDDLVQVFIQLDEPSVAEFAADGADRAAQQAHGQTVQAQQDSVRSDLGSMIADELSSLVVGANGFRAMVRAGDIPAIRATDGVESVASVTRYHLDNETSVPWIGGDTVQDAGFTGEGTTIAVIDTGIDYTHASFNLAGDPGDAPSFNDVPADHLFHTEIIWLAVQDITRGCNPPANDEFCPSGEVTRAQMAAFLNRALSLPSTDEDFFTDDDDSIFEGDINRLAAAGITRGCNPPDNDEYCPGDPITRAQMATFMVRAFGFTEGAGDDLFTDDDSSVHEDAIDILGTAGVTRGCNPPDNDNFCPSDNITRGQMAAFIFRAFDAAGLDSLPVPPAPPPYDGAERYEENDPGVIESGTFPTEKVIGGFDFAGPTYDASVDSLSTPSPDPDPLDVNGHGTHVAGSAAGYVPASGVVGRGMAPDARLMALKVFGDVAGSTDLVSDAIERALDPNNDMSIDDAVDVINMSLGSPYGHPDDPSAIATQNAVDLGIVVVASAGNSGPIPYVTGSPAVADGAISVAASADGGVTALALRVNSPASIADDYEAQGSDFGPLDPPTTGDLAIASPLDACTALAGDMTGEVALIQRGTCSFTTKVRNAQDAGAIGALVFNNEPGAPITMAHDGTEPVPTIPAMMVNQADGETIQAVAEGTTVNVTLSEDVTIPKPELADTMAGFTSRGPGLGTVFKPDVSAPGFSIGSADVGTGDGLALSSGTSMAAPHIAGAAAQLLDKDPDLTPGEVKALLMNSARPALPEGGVPIAEQGTGVVQVDRAVLDLGGYAMPAGLSFGRLNPTTAGSETDTVQVTRFDGDATYDVELVENQTVSGVSWSLSSGSLSTSGGTGSVDVTVTVDPDEMPPDDGFNSQTESDGWVVLTNQADPDDQMVVGLMTAVDPASQVTATGAGGSVDIANPGPGPGFADGFTHVTGGSDILSAVGYRTGFVPEEDGGPYDTIDFGVAVDAPWGSGASMEVDIFIDVDQDDTDDFVLVAADLGFLQNAAPTGDLVTALFDLGAGTATLLYFAVSDFNDEVMVLPADLTGEFGFLEDGDTTFDITTVVFDQLGFAGGSPTVSVDLDAEITADEQSLAVPTGAMETVPFSGTGDMLWLFPNNPVSSQFSIAEVTAP